MASTKYLKGECQHCSGHLEFPAESAGMTADCPHCGQSTELLLARPPEEPTVPRRAIIWAIVGLVILGAGLGASLVALRMAERKVGRLKQKPSVKAEVGEVAAQEPASAPTDPLARQGYSASPIRLEKAPDSSLVYATGTLKNLTPRQRFGVKLEIELADAAGQKLGTATDYQNVLEGGAEWRFRALVVDAKAASAKLVGIKEAP